MFVRTHEDITGTENEMVRRDGNKSLRSFRMLTKADGCGFSLSDAYFSAGFSLDLWYKNHVEANFIVSGVVHLEDLSTGHRVGTWRGVLCTWSGRGTSIG